MSNIEFVQGQESHSSNWGKYYVKGLEKWQVKEDFECEINDRHHNYNGYVCNDVPEGTIFTIFEQSGNKHGTDTFYFLICQATDEQVEKDKADYGRAFIEGNFKILVRAEGKTKAPRLMGWWNDSKDHSLAFANHCAIYINKRGIKELPPLETEVKA